jgi:hypothetical protein
MISYRGALSTAFYAGAFVCLALFLILWFYVAPGLSVALLGISAIVFIALAITFDERL